MTSPNDIGEMEPQNPSTFAVPNLESYFRETSALNGEDDPDVTINDHSTPVFINLRESIPIPEAEGQMPRIFGVPGKIYGPAVLILGGIMVYMLRGRKRGGRGKRRGQLEKVNCWFCNEDQNVEAYKTDGFVCKKCDQYNGFTKDGDYNQVIPEQHYNSLNDQKFNSMRQNANRYTKTTETLCDKCNSEQWMKLRREREFNPDIPSDDDEGYEQALRGFRAQLDKEYPLCIKCEYLLRVQELGKYNPLYNKWLSAFRQRTISGTGDFLEAVAAAQDLKAYSRSIAHRVARYMTSQGFSAITLPVFVNFMTDVMNSTIHKILQFSPMLRIIPLPNDLLCTAHLLPLLFFARIAGVIALSESYFGVALRLFWLFDLCTTYVYTDWWSEYAWATLIVSCGTWAGINSLAALCVSSSMATTEVTPVRNAGRKSRLERVGEHSASLEEMCTELAPLGEAHADGGGEDLMSELGGLKLKASVNPAARSGSSFTTAFSHIPENPRDRQGILQTPPPSDIARTLFSRKISGGENGAAMPNRNRWSSAPQSPPRVTALSPERMDVDSDESDTENTLVPSRHRQSPHSTIPFQRTPRLNQFSPQHQGLPTHSFSPSHETVLPSDSVSQVDGRAFQPGQFTPLTSHNLQHHEQMHNRSSAGGRKGFSTSTQFSNDLDHATHNSYHAGMARRRNVPGSQIDTQFSSNRALRPHSHQPEPSRCSAQARQQFPHYNSSPSPSRSQTTRFSSIPRQSGPGSPGGFSDFSGFTTTTMVQQENNNKVLLAGMAFLISLNTIVIVVVMKYFAKN